MTHIIIIGDLSKGFTFTGPFDSWEEAADYDTTSATHNPDELDTQIVELKEPDKEWWGTDEEVET